MAERITHLSGEYWRARMRGEARFDAVEVDLTVEEVDVWMADKPGQYIVRQGRARTWVLILDPDTALEFKLRFG